MEICYIDFSACQETTKKASCFDASYDDITLKILESIIIGQKKFHPLESLLLQEQWRISEWDISAMPFRRRRFGDGCLGNTPSAMDVSLMDFRWTLLFPNFLTYTQC